MVPAGGIRTIQTISIRGCCGGEGVRGLWSRGACESSSFQCCPLSHQGHFCSQSLTGAQVGARLRPSGPRMPGHLGLETGQWKDSPWWPASKLL